MTKKVQSCVRLQAESKIQKSKNFRNFEIRIYFSFFSYRIDFQELIFHTYLGKVNEFGGSWPPNNLIFRRGGAESAPPLTNRVNLFIKIKIINW